MAGSNSEANSLMSVEQSPARQKAGGLKLLRRPAVLEKLGIGRTQLDEAIRRGLLKPPVSILPGGRAVGFLSDEIDAFIESRRAERDGSGK
jgi:predicted DNA-binding transcriptional regulator AlpA